MTKQSKKTSLDELLEQKNETSQYHIFYLMAHKLNEEIEDSDFEYDDSNIILKDMYITASELEEINNGKYPWIENIKENWDADILSQRYIDDIVALNESILGYVVLDSSNKIVTQTGINIINFNESHGNDKNGRYMSIHSPHRSCANYSIVDTQNGNYLSSPYGIYNARERHIEKFKQEESKTNQNLESYEPLIY